MHLGSAEVGVCLFFLTLLKSRPAKSEMLIMPVIFLFSLILMFELPVLAKDQRVGCYEQAPVIKKYFSVILSEDSGPQDIKKMGVICQQLSQGETFRFAKEGAKWESTQDEVADGKKLLSLQPLTAQKSFQEKINKIKNKSSLSQRLAAAYRESVKYFGEFDLATLNTSAGILQEVKSFGAQGRDIQRTLFVAYGLSLVKKDSKEFEIRVLASSLEKDSSQIHSWIQVRLPAVKNERIIFDLEPSLSGMIFTPLFPRRTGFPELSRVSALEECPKLRLCLMKQFVQSVADAKKETP